MKFAVATILTLASFCLGLGLVLTIADMTSAPSWLYAALLGVGAVLTVAGLIGGRQVRQKQMRQEEA